MTAMTGNIPTSAIPTTEPIKQVWEKPKVMVSDAKSAETNPGFLAEAPLTS